MRLTGLTADTLSTILAAVGLLFLVGCAETGPLEERPAAYAMPGQPATQPSRSGRVYAVRGFANIFSLGMDTIAGKLQQKGIIATAHQDDQWQAIARQIILDRRPQDVYRAWLRVPQPTVDAPEPLVLIGHSWGADDCIRIAQVLAKHGIRVDLLVTVEAVTPPGIPSNVVRAWNIYKPRAMDFLPWWRGVPLHADEPDRTQLTQIDISRDWLAVDSWWLGHSDVDNLPAIEDRIVSIVMETCPPAPPDLRVMAQEKIFEGATTRPAPAGSKDASDAR